MRSFVWKIGGEAGFGIMTTGVLFAKTAARYGYNVFDYAEYPSLIRGGHNTYEVALSADPVRSMRQGVDILVCLNEETYLQHRHRLTDSSVIVYDRDIWQMPEGAVGQSLHVPFREILKEEKGIEIMRNTIAMGVSLALMGWPIDELKKSLEKSFAKKSQEVVDQNVRVATRGYQLVHEQYAQLITRDFPIIEGAPPKAVITANDAFSLGAVAADCRFYAAYPMTPASTVLSTLAGWAERTGMVVRHVEDEIAVAGAALGASFGGARAAVGSSGGGFALMVEMISFSGVAEIPLVVFLSQRPGPATGMPTWTEQGDLLFAVHAGHGEFPKIVLAPGDMQEMYELTMKAFDLADIYQTTVIVMSDKLISESHASVDAVRMTEALEKHAPDRGKIITETAEKPYLRYKLTDDGISPMLIPGQEGIYYQSNSYTHIEDGHTTEDAQPKIDHTHKLLQKEKTYLERHFAAPQYFGDPVADTVLVSWGGNKGTLLDAIELLAAQGKKVGYLHFTHLFPMDVAQVKAAFVDGKRYILVENNATAQFGTLLRAYAGVDLTEKFLKYDGRPVYVEEIIKYINRV